MRGNSRTGIESSGGLLPTASAAMPFHVKAGMAKSADAVDSK